MDLEAVDHILMTTRSVKKRLDFTRSVEPVDDFKPAKRLPVEEVTYWNGWGQQR